MLRHCTFYLPQDIIRCDRRSVVVEDGDEFGGVGAELDHHQTAELSVAVLFDDEDTLVRLDKFAKGLAEWKRPDAHRVEVNSL